MNLLDYVLMILQPPFQAADTCIVMCEAAVIWHPRFRTQWDSGNAAGVAVLFPRRDRPQAFVLRETVFQSIRATNTRGAPINVPWEAALNPCSHQQVPKHENVILFWTEPPEDSEEKQLSRRSPLHRARRDSQTQACSYFTRQLCNKLHSLLLCIHLETWNGLPGMYYTCLCFQGRLATISDKNWPPTGTN